MKKAKKIMSNNGGFSLVELIVVIVIMLVLAAAIVPNVSKYIGMAGNANTKNDASSMLTQVQAEVAEKVAEALQNKKKPGKGDYAYGNITLGKITASSQGSKADAKYDTAPEDNVAAQAKYHVDESTYQVDAFAYWDGGSFINWTLEHGWYDIDKKVE